MKDLLRTTNKIDNMTNEEGEKKYGKPIDYDINGNVMYENPEYGKKKANRIHDFIFGRKLLTK
ncbi:hypothetical protein BGV40_09260 [Methanosarcina sp. Ant1]|nr:hypothetical protein BGV40_09260 [Methanosarcina sp. Ant1]